MDEKKLRNNTQILYLSDHGDNIGERDFWGKSNFYEGSVGIPCIINGPNIPVGKVCKTPVSLIDVHPTILKNAGITSEAKPGTSLIELANSEDDPERLVFSEYQPWGQQLVHLWYVKEIGNSYIMCQCNHSCLIFLKIQMS